MTYSTKTLTNGDNAPLFNLADSNNKRLILRDEAGQPLLLFFYAHDDLPGCRDIACGFRDLEPIFTNFNIKILGISLDSPESRGIFAQEYDISFSLLSDLDQSVSQQYGVCFPKDANDRSIMSYNRTAFLLATNLRIVKIYRLAEGQVALKEILEDIKFLLPREEPQPVKMQAPVLLIPNVLERDFCRQLIEIWETEGNAESGSMRREGEKTIGVIDYSMKIRRDHFIKEGEIKNRLERIMARRVYPEIDKAFNFKATRSEGYKIACYDGSKGGYFRAHRDNTTKGTAHRRFAMTLNLNVGEYEGGYLRFAEYAPHLYKPDTGSAVIFSCSLLHEATDVTAGLRFVLLTFFYGEKEAEERLAYELRVQNDYSNIIRLTDRSE